MFIKTCGFIVTFNIRIRKIYLIILILSCVEIFYFYYKKNQILNVSIHMSIIVTNLLNYSLKANYFVFLFHKTVWRAICHWKSLSFKWDEYSKCRFLVFMSVLCKVHICCIKKTGSHCAALSQLPIWYQWRCALFSTIIICEGFSSLSNYAQKNKLSLAYLMIPKLRCGISLAVGYI